MKKQFFESLRKVSETTVNISDEMLQGIADELRFTGDMDQFIKGFGVETEHWKSSSNFFQIGAIVKDHLDEHPYYYDALIAMETELESEESEEVYEGATGFGVIHPDLGYTPSAVSEIIKRFKENSTPVGTILNEICDKKTEDNLYKELRKHRYAVRDNEKVRVDFIKNYGQVYKTFPGAVVVTIYASYIYDPGYSSHYCYITVEYLLESLKGEKKRIAEDYSAVCR